MPNHMQEKDESSIAMEGLIQYRTTHQRGSNENMEPPIINCICEIAYVQLVCVL